MGYNIVLVLALRVILFGLMIMANNDSFAPITSASRVSDGLWYVGSWGQQVTTARRTEMLLAGTGTS